MQIDTRSGIAFESDTGQFGVGEPLPGGRDLIAAGHRKSGERIGAGAIALRRALQAGLRILNRDLYSRDRGLGAVRDPAINGSRIGRLGAQRKRVNEDRKKCE